MISELQKVPYMLKKPDQDMTQWMYGRRRRRIQYCKAQLIQCKDVFDPVVVCKETVEQMRQGRSTEGSNDKCTLMDTLTSVCRSPKILLNIQLKGFHCR